MIISKIDAGHVAALSDLYGTKFRELTPAKTQYTLPDHTIEKPATITIDSQLPTPRKGNPGAVKTFINVRSTIVLDEGLTTERNVPMVVKIETSFPLGSSIADRHKAAHRAASVLLSDDANFDSLFYNGILPE